MLVLFDEGDGIDFEVVVVMQFDVIFVVYFGLMQVEYDMFSQIVLVIVYFDSVWVIDWCDMIWLNSVGFGMVVQGDVLIVSIDVQIVEIVVCYFELYDKFVMFIIYLDMIDLSWVNFYIVNDMWVKFFVDLGLIVFKSV